MDKLIEPIKNETCEVEVIECPLSIAKLKSPRTVVSENQSDDYNIEEITEKTNSQIQLKVNNNNCNVNAISNVCGDVDKAEPITKIIKSNVHTEISGDINISNNTIKRKMTRVPRKKLSDIYDSGSDFDEIDPTPKRKKSKNSDIDPDFGVLFSTTKKKMSENIDYDLKNIDPAPKRKKLKMCDTEHELETKGLTLNIKNSKPSNNHEVHETVLSPNRTESNKLDQIASTSKRKKAVTDIDGIKLKSEKISSIKISKSISDQLKKMIIDSIETGVCTRKTAASVFQVPYSTVVHVYKKFLETGVVEKQNREEKLQEEHIRFLSDTLAENCSYTIKELTSMIQDRFSIEVSNASVSKKIAAFYYNIKIVHEFPTTKVTPEIICDHKEFCQLFLELHNAGRHMVYFDEAAFSVWMRRFYGRVDPLLPGQVTAPSLRKRHRTILASMTKNKLLYCKTFIEPRTKNNLFEYVTELFCLLKKEGMCEAVIIMGTSAFNHAEEIKEMAQVEGHQLLFLPSHNKWFNPVESTFLQWIKTIHSKKPVNEKHMEHLIDCFNSLTGDKHCPAYFTQVVDNANRCLKGLLNYDE